MDPQPSNRPLRPAPVALDEHARDNLRFIRETMERASSFTAVPGWGGVAMGITALGAAAVASRQPSSVGWFITWLSEAAVAFGIASFTTLTKARRANVPILAGPGRKFALSFAPPVFVAALAYCDFISGWVNLGDSWCVVVALRDRGDYRRSIFDSSGAFDGALLYGAGYGGAVFAGELGKYSAGGWIWRIAHYFWRGDCEKLWRINRTRRERSGWINSPRANLRLLGSYGLRRDRAKFLLRSLTG